jgi:hypothetical protein
MNQLRCSWCEIPLTTDRAASGWCGSCGKRLPFTASIRGLDPEEDRIATVGEVTCLMCENRPARCQIDLDLTKGAENQGRRMAAKPFEYYYQVWEKFPRSPCCSRCMLLYWSWRSVRILFVIAALIAGLFAIYQLSESRKQGGWATVTWFFVGWLLIAVCMAATSFSDWVQEAWYGTRLRSRMRGPSREPSATADWGSE